jgi:hypothetical protein
VAEWIPDDASKTVEVKARAPESLILDHVTVLFPPPLKELVAEPEVFEFWWKQLDYVFNLPDPRAFRRCQTSCHRTSASRSSGTSTSLHSSRVVDS